MRLKKDGIQRNRSYASRDLVGGWDEWTRWPYPSIDRCVMIPTEGTGKSFFVMILVLGATREIIGVRHKDVDELRQHLLAEGVLVEQGRSVPNEYRQPLNFKIPVVAGAICTVCFLFGLGIYGFKMAGRQPQQADANAAREHLRELREDTRRDIEQFRTATQFHRAGPDPAAPRPTRERAARPSPAGHRCPSRTLARAARHQRLEAGAAWDPARVVRSAASDRVGQDVG